MSECYDFYIKMQVRTSHDCPASKRGEKDRVISESYFPFSCAFAEQAYLMVDGVMSHFPFEIVAEYNDIPYSYYIIIELYPDKESGETSKDVLQRAYAGIRVGRDKEARMVFEQVLKAIPLRTNAEWWDWKPKWAKEKTNA